MATVYIYTARIESTALRRKGGGNREEGGGRVATSIRGSTCNRVRATLGVSALRVSRP